MVKSECKFQSERSSKIAGISSFSSSSKRKYKGVRMRSWGSWVSEIRAPNQKTRIWLGSYSTAEAAARAYDAALLCLKGSSAANNLNFPVSRSHYIPDSVMSPKSIQRVAAAAAASCFTDTAAVDSAVSSPQLPCSSPSPSPSSSSSSSSLSCQSPCDHQPDVYDGDVLSLVQSFETYNHHDGYLWSGLDDQLQSPTTKFLDQPFININGYPASSFGPPPPLTIDDFFDGDIRLWSFPE